MRKLKTHNYINCESIENDIDIDIESIKSIKLFFKEIESDNRLVNKEIDKVKQKVCNQENLDILDFFNKRRMEQHAIFLTKKIKKNSSEIKKIQIECNLNIESSLFPPESSIVRDLQESIRENIELLFSLSPLYVRKLLRNDTTKYRSIHDDLATAPPLTSIVQKNNSHDAIDSFVDSNKALKLPKPLEKGEKRTKDHPDYYERWADRENKDEAPLDFLERVWGGHIRAGLLYQTDLRGEKFGEHPKKALDKTLFDRVFEECKKRGLKIRDSVPNKSHKVSQRIARTLQKNLAA